MTIASNLGFPPLGAARELKRATEGYWSGKVTREQLLATGAELRRRHWQLQRDIGVSRIPANDFSFYDRMPDTWAAGGAERAADVPAAREDEGRGMRLAVAARCAAAGLRRRAGFAGRRGRDVGTARRAVPRAGSHGIGRA